MKDRHVPRRSGGRGARTATRPPARRAGGGWLPAFLRPLFWEYDFHRLRWDVDRDLVIRRVLAEGDWEATRWLRRQADADALRAWLVARRGRGIDPRRLRFWELILELPRREVEAWLREAARHPWSRRLHE